MRSSIGTNHVSSTARRKAACLSALPLLLAACGDTVIEHEDTAETVLGDVPLETPDPRAQPEARELPEGDPINSDVSRNDPGGPSPVPLPGGGSPDGGAGGPGGGLDGGIVPPMVGYTIAPPATLSLDGESIDAGEFTVEEATAYSYENGVGTPHPIVTTADTPVFIQAQIGDLTPHNLFDIPGDAEVLRLVGFFDPTVPDLPPTRFDVTMFGIFAVQNDCTIYLPRSSSDICPQVTGLGTSTDLNDNVDLFFSSPPDPSDYDPIRSAFPGEPGRIDPNQAPLSTMTTCSAASSMQKHGTSSSLALPVQPCDSQQVAGSDQPESRTIELGRSSGTVSLSYNTFSIEDRIVVTYEGTELFDSGCVGESNTQSISFNGQSTQMTVRVEPNCAGDSGTSWNFSLTCPS